MLGYIDAGTGSLLVQAIAGGTAATVIFVKFYWHRLLRHLHLGKTEDEAEVLSD